MYIRHLHLEDFRSWKQLELNLQPGITVFSGSNGHGKTNIVEALGYLAHQSSHRVNSDAALVRENTDHASLSATAVNGTRELTARLIIRPHAANKAFINRTALATPRELQGIVRTTLFSPEDLALIRGEPEQRRTFLDSIMIARYPRLAGVKADYERVLKQRNALLRSHAMRAALDGAHSPQEEAALSTLDVWDGQLAALGGQIMSARVQIVHDLSPHVVHTYQRLAPESRPAHMAYSSTVDASLAQVGVHLGHSSPDVSPALVSPEVAEATLLQECASRRAQEIERGTTLLGPHRDDLLVYLGTQPAKGFASHGESWSFALSLRLAAFFMQRGDGTEPIVILDDVFAELDFSRRHSLVSLIRDAQQVLITAAVQEDIPRELLKDAHVYAVGVRLTEEGKISEMQQRNDLLSSVESTAVKTVQAAQAVHIMHAAETSEAGMVKKGSVDENE